ncbi:kinase-like domain-containing protein [Blastocladiella britannica]|nr:kinase-like domain-containing protein [Blastocladiella britannica]
MTALPAWTGRPYTKPNSLPSGWSQPPPSPRSSAFLHPPPPPPPPPPPANNKLKHSDSTMTTAPPPAAGWQQPLPTLGTLAKHLPNALREVYEITKYELWFGRSAQADVTLAGAECSKMHARIFALIEPSMDPAAQSQSGLPRMVWMIEDRSTNGTYINGKRLPLRTPTPLYSADLIEIKIGNFFEFASPLAVNPKANDTLQDPEYVEIASHYMLTRQLGSGSYAHVFAAQNLHSGRRYAIKVINKRKAGLPAVRPPGHTIPEIEIMRSMNHVNLVRVYDYKETRKHLYVIMDLVKSGELFDFLAQSQGLKESDCRVIMYQTFQALKYLHKRRIAHRDLKPENILLDWTREFPRVVLADFGLARSSAASNERLTTLCGTLNYVAPEILSDSRRDDGYGRPVDLWACGVMMYFLLSCKLPFEDVQDPELKKKIRAGEFVFDVVHHVGGPNVWDAISDDAKDLIRQLLVVDPSERLTASKALQHPWITAKEPELRLIYAELHNHWANRRAPDADFPDIEAIPPAELMTQLPVGSQFAAPEPLTAVGR